MTVWMYHTLRAVRSFQLVNQHKDIVMYSKAGVKETGF